MYQTVQTGNNHINVTITPLRKSATGSLDVILLGSDMSNHIDNQSV